ncbi:MAG: DUF120 domain-containing protein, partial [Methanocorpusculum sp.]|nr:DUF120 domain-containing protein [Methanocorpusculum sp.]
MITNIAAEDTVCLRKIASLGGCRGSVRISTQTLGEMLGISQQTASRRLQSLEREKLITRSPESTGQYILITKEGEEHLRREYAEYSKIFADSENQYILKGTVVSGVGEGRYYMSIPHYQNMFAELCGFTPYPGTLNVKLNPQSMQIRNRMEGMEWTIVPGFKDEHRQFGDARCIKCLINNIPCAIVAPGRTHHPPEITEIIAGVQLRKELKLEDGAEV